MSANPAENPFASPANEDSFQFGTRPDGTDMGVLGFFFGFSGRIGRLPFFLAFIGFLLPLYLINDKLTPHVPGPVLWPLQGVFVWSFYALVVKRWHDQDRSGWATLLLLAPLVNLFAMFALFVHHSEPSERFGPMPR